MNNKPSSEPGIRTPVVYAVLGILALAAILLMLRGKSNQPDKPGAGHATTQKIATATSSNFLAVSPSSPMRTTRPVVYNSGTPGTPSTGASTPAAMARPPVDPSMRQMVQSLTNLTGVALTAETAGQWRTNLQQLIKSGPGALGAIREFLEQNTDINFSALPQGTNLLGHASLRLALLDAVTSIGGPEAQSLLLDTLQTTADPREIAWLASALTKESPDQFRDQILGAVRDTIRMAAEGKLGNRDIGPLFGVLAQQGGTEAVNELRQAASGPWKYYATIAMAQLPDGSGVAELGRILNDPESANAGLRTPAIQALAQLAPENPDARNLFLEQVKKGNLPSGAWINAALAIAGEQFYIGTPPAGGVNYRSWNLRSGNQQFYSMMQPLTPEQIIQRLAFLDELKNLSNLPSATSAIENARRRLLERLPRQ